jgi:hypothetical protein
MMLRAESSERAHVLLTGPPASAILKALKSFPRIPHQMN